MMKMRCLFLVLALGCGLCAQQARAQTSEQVMTFSIICQYATNNITVTNPTTQVVTHYLVEDTVLLNTENLVKAMAIDMLKTNWAQWQGADICYEVNLANGNEGIYLRLGPKQTNVSSFFGNSFTNTFAQNASNVFTGTNYATSLPLGGDNNEQSGQTITSSKFMGNLAYLTFNSSNLAFNIFGYSQGPIVYGSGVLDGQLYERYLHEAQIAGAGTFTLNVSTNVYLIPTSNGTPTNFTGIAHGNVFVQTPFFLPFGPPEGP
jgi:hypothetical protein